MLNTTVSFMWEGCWGFYPRTRVTGEVIDQRTRASGRVEVLVQSPALKTPKWVDAAEIEKATPAAEAAAIA